MGKSINTVVRTSPHETGKTMIAIGADESDDSLTLVKFESDKLPEGKIIGNLRGDKFSETVFLKGIVFVIGGDMIDLWNRVSTFDIFSGKTGRVADLQINRIGSHSITTSLDEIFVCGGCVSDASKTCEAFDPRTNVWRSLPDMGQGREGFALVFLSDARLIAIGGWNDLDVLSSCEILEIASPLAAWRPVASMRQARNCHAAVQFGNRVFVAGGISLTSSEIFTPPPFGSTTEIGQWTCILPRMTNAFEWSRSLVVVSANEIIIFGAIEGENGDEGVVERFARNPLALREGVDFETWTWTPLPRVSHLVNGYVYGVHGIN